MIFNSNWAFCLISNCIFCFFVFIFDFFNTLVHFFLKFLNFFIIFVRITAGNLIFDFLHLLKSFGKIIHFWFQFGNIGLSQGRFLYLWFSVIEHFSFYILRKLRLFNQMLLILGKNFPHSNKFSTGKFLP